MSFEIKGDDVSVDEIMRMVRKRIEEKRQTLYTDEEIRQIAEHRLDAVLDAHDFNSDFIADFRSEPLRWNYQFGPETLYRSSRGAVGQALEKLRGLLKPIQKLLDRKSTRLNSSHLVISYAVFCLKKKKTIILQYR